MDLIDQIRLLSSRIASQKDLIQTEEATKNAMIMPFIQLLGYNVFDPTEVTPELISDIGTKKGEKVDYAILREGKPIMLFECKKSGGDLSINHAGQLFRYFHVTEARFGVLTNGIDYRFFTDLEQPNKMDEKPFFEFNILDFKERDIEEIKKFTKSAFDVPSILETASELKYTRAVKATLANLMQTPSEDFVRLVAADLIGNRRFTTAVCDQFTRITKSAFELLIAEKINERLKGAMSPELISVVRAEPKIESASKNEGASSEGEEVQTTLDELQAYYNVRAILRANISPARIFMRDAKSYCAILLDDNNRRPVCRLYFNNPAKLSVGFMNDKKEESRIAINDVDDLFDHGGLLLAAITPYIGAKPSSETE